MCVRCACMSHRCHSQHFSCWKPSKVEAARNVVTIFLFIHPQYVLPLPVTSLLDLNANIPDSGTSASKAVYPGVSTAADRARAHATPLLTFGPSFFLARDCTANCGGSDLEYRHTGQRGKCQFEGGGRIAAGGGGILVRRKHPSIVERKDDTWTTYILQEGYKNVPAIRVSPHPSLANARPSVDVFPLGPT